MKLLWHDTAWAYYKYWQTQDKKTLKRINNLLNDIERKIGLVERPNQRKEPFDIQNRE